MSSAATLIASAIPGAMLCLVATSGVFGLTVTVMAYVVAPRSRQVLRPTRAALMPVPLAMRCERR